MVDRIRILSKFNSSRTVTAFAAVGVSIAMLAAGVWYVAMRIRILDQNIVELGAAIWVAEEKRIQARSAAILLERRAGDIARIKSVRVSRTEPVAFIELLETIADRTDNKIGLAIEDGAADTDAIGFRVTVSGTAASVRHFLRAIETVPHFIEITEIIFQRMGSEDLDQRATLTLAIRVSASQ